MKPDIWPTRGLTIRQSLMPRARPMPEIPAPQPKPPARAGTDFSTTWRHSDPLQEALDYYERALKSSPLAIKHRRL